MESALQSLCSDSVPEPRKPSLEESEFADAIRDGLGRPSGKVISPRYLYDELGSTLFEAITLLPEYGLTRADERILARHSGEIAASCGPLAAIAELGSGSGKKTTHILQAAVEANENLSYHPIDVSSAALAACGREVGSLCRVCPTCADWSEGLAQIASHRTGRLPLLLLFLGSSVGNLERAAVPQFLQTVHSQLRPGDFFLLGADLEKDVPTMLAAYDDPTGVTAAFNLNLLGRINRELGADFNLRCFSHEARWNIALRRIEMHLVSRLTQDVHIPALDATFSFAEGESIWTESSHKFNSEELGTLGRENGFLPINAWTDESWPMAEVLWRAV